MLAVEHRVSEGSEEVSVLAKKIENEVKYSDPIVPAQLAGLEKEIHDKSAKLLDSIKIGDLDTNSMLKEAQDLFDLIKERNEKSKLYK